MDRNVDEDPEAYDDLLALGFRSVPVTLIAGTTIRGYDEAGLRAAIEAAARS